MKKSKRRPDKLALKREIVRQLTNQDLGRIGAGTYEPIIPCSCVNPIYSA